MDDGNGSLPWHLYVRVHICLPRGSVSLPFRLYVEFPRFTTNGMKPNASNTMSAKSLKRLMTRQRYKKIALYRQIPLEIFAALVFSIIRNKSRPLSYYRNKQSKTDTFRVLTFDCSLFESL
jgi:hypothetical protein